MKPTFVTRLAVRKFWLPLLVGGFALQFGGCDPTVRETVLTGLQTSLVGLVTAILNAFFLSLSSGVSTTQTVVQAAFESFQNVLA